MNILAQDFNTKSLMKYAAPTVLMMLFLSTYTIVDGLFVAKYVGENALAATNIVWPVFNIVLAIGLMFSTGGTAIMGKLMGEGRAEEARSFLSILYIVVIALGAVLTAFILTFPHQIVHFLGVEEDLYFYAMEYLQALGLFATSYFLQVYVQTFFVLAGKPSLGFIICFVGGMTNIALDYVFISPHMLNLGIAGAGYATGIGNCVPAVFGMLYFLCNRKGTLYFGRPVLRLRQLFKGMANGMSELVSQLAMAITTLAFNLILLNLVGTAGVASICVILYLQLIQTALYFGYAIGVAPIISYKYGAQDTEGLRNVLGISFKFIATVSVAVISFSLLFDDFAVSIFIENTSDTYNMAKEGLRIFSLAYIFMGINIFTSSMFTALSNGRVSALLSMSRTLVFLLACLLILPHFFGITGVWLTVPVAELLACILAGYFYKRGKIEYGY